MMASDDRAGGQSENPGKSSNGEVMIFPLVGVGFTDNPKCGGGMHPSSAGPAVDACFS